VTGWRCCVAGGRVEIRSSQSGPGRGNSQA